MLSGVPMTRKRPFASLELAKISPPRGMGCLAGVSSAVCRGPSFGVDDAEGRLRRLLRVRPCSWMIQRASGIRNRGFGPSDQAADGQTPGNEPLAACSWGVPRPLLLTVPTFTSHALPRPLGLRLCGARRRLAFHVDLGMPSTGRGDGQGDRWKQPPADVYAVYCAALASGLGLGARVL